MRTGEAQMSQRRRRGSPGELGGGKWSPGGPQNSLGWSCAFLPHRSLMPRTLESQITLEKTPSYFVTQEAPRRIFNMSRDTKLIVVVRNPVTRAISDYTQTLSKKPDIPTFEGLSFRNRTLGLVDVSWNAIRIGMYALHLESWLRYFPLAQIHFVSGERLITDPAGEMGRVQDFLGIKRLITDKHFYFNKTKGFPCLKKTESSLLPRCLGKSKGRTHVQIDPEVIDQLREFYRPYNIKFYETVGQDFRWEWAKEIQGSSASLFHEVCPESLCPSSLSESRLQPLFPSWVPSSWNGEAQLKAKRPVGGGVGGPCH